MTMLLMIIIGLVILDSTDQQGPSIEVPGVCIVRGSDFRSAICRATSDDSLLYFKANDTEIYSDAKAAELGFNISLDHDDAGRMYRTLTATNVQYPMKLVCIESLPVAEGREINEILSYSIRVEDECDPPLVTAHSGADNGYDSLNMTNATTGPQSSGRDGIITAAVVTVLVTILVIVVIVGLLVYYYRCRRRPLPNNNDLDGHPTDPSNHGAGGGLPLDEINPPPPDIHEDNGDPLPVVPEDNRDSTIFTARRLSKRSPPRSDMSRAVESGSKASSACEPTVDFKVQGINAENSDPSMEVPTAAEQCTDEGRMPRTYCYGDQIHVNMNDSYENPTYCVNPARSQGREEISPV